MMSDQIDQQVYRDFAENRGIFAPGAKNVNVYDKSGNLVGTIKRVMNFDGVADAHVGEAALVGGQGFIATVAHDYNNAVITFAQRFGATSDTVFYDSYRTINILNAWGDKENYTYDYRVQRLSKIVTEATATAYLTDKSYLDNMAGRDCVRVGSGTQSIAVGDGVSSTVAGGYSYLTGGTLQFDGQAKEPGSGTPVVGDAYTYEAYRFWYNYKKPDASSPLNIGVTGGDSGSPTYVFNEKTQQWEWVGAGQSGGGDGYGAFSQMRSGNIWAAELISSYDLAVSSATGGGYIYLSAADSQGRGRITQDGHSTAFTGLASGMRGDTSTLGTLADNKSLDACHNLVFGGAGGTLVLQGSLDTGAGSLTFNSDYVLTNEGDAARRLNSAGFVVNAGAALITELTGASGDEWRKMGAGAFIVSGSGDNLADLNVGGNGLVALSRTGGAAAHNVKINGGEVVVRLKDASQISGEFIFGHRGGIVDMNGNDLTFSHVVHLDEGAAFANFKAGTTATFTNTGSADDTYQGRFMDGGSLDKGLLDVVYAPTYAGNTWNLSGVVSNKGTWRLKGRVQIAGTRVKHAGGYVDQNDWNAAVFDTGDVFIESKWSFRVGDHSVVKSNVLVGDNATYEINGYSRQIGDVTLQGMQSHYNVTFSYGSSSQEGKLSGTGSFWKSGSGTFYLTNDENDFSGVKGVGQGLLVANSLSALGQGTGDWDIRQMGTLSVKGAGVAEALGRINRKSWGVYALAGDDAGSVSLAGYSNLFIGATDKAAWGAPGTESVLTGWTEDGGWKLGGGGGELTVNWKLSGKGTLEIGSLLNRGSVILANIHNSDTVGGSPFEGLIKVDNGASLGYTDIRALGAGRNNILVVKGTAFDLGDEVAGALGHIHQDSAGVLNFKGDYAGNLDMAALGLNAVYLGANTEATLSGTITPGSKGYRFSGHGTLTIAGDLAGDGELTVEDLRIYPSGKIILTGNNTYSGMTGIMAGSTLQIGDGGTRGTLGSNGVWNQGELCLNRSDNVILNQDIAGTGDFTQKGAGSVTLTNVRYTGRTMIESGTLSFGNGGELKNLSTASISNKGVLKFNFSNNVSSSLGISGTGKLVKEGSGKLSLSGTSTYTGGTFVNEGILQVGTGDSGGLIRGELSIGAKGQVSLTGGDSLGYNGDVNCVGRINITGGLLYFADGGNQTFKNTVFTLSGGRIDGVASGRFDVWENTSFKVLASDESSVISGTRLQLRAANSTSFDVEEGKADADLLVSSVIVNSSQGIFSFTKSGAGTMVLTGNNTYTGTTTISAGTLRVGNGGTDGTLGSGDVVNNGTLEIKRTSDYALSHVISGKGRLLISGTGTVTLTGNNTYTGTTTLLNGILSLADGGALGQGEIINNAVLRVTRSGEYLLSQKMSGTGQLVKTGTGSLIVSAGNTYQGGTFLESGVLIAGSDTAFGLGRISVSGGILDMNGKKAGNAIEVTRDAVLKSAGSMTGDLTLMSGTLTLNGPARGGKVTLTSGVIKGDSLEASSYAVLSGEVASALYGTGSLTKTTSGRVELSGMGHYTGETLVKEGELEVSGKLFSSAVTVEKDAVLNVSGGVESDITLKEGAVLRTNTAAGMTLVSGQILRAGHVSGTVRDIIGSLAVVGGSSLAAQGQLFLDGNLTLKGGSLVLDTEDSLFVSGSLNVAASSSLDLNGFVKTNRYILASFSSFGGSLDDLAINTSFTGETRLTYTLHKTESQLSLQVTGEALDLIWTGGNGVWKTKGDHKWMLPGGSVSDDRFYAGDRVVFDSSGIVTLEGELTPGNVLVSGAADITFSGAGRIMGNTGVTMDSTGTLSLNADNGYKGGTLINAGRVAATGSRSFGTGEIHLKGGVLDLAGQAVSNSLIAEGGTLEGGGAFAGRLEVQGTGVFTLSGMNRSKSFVLSGGTMAGGSLSAERFDVTQGRAESALTGNGSLKKSGAGEVILAGVNSYSGTTWLNEGTLTLARGGVLDSSLIAKSGSRLNLYGSAARDITMESGAVLYTGGDASGLVLSRGQTLTAGHLSGSSADIVGQVTTSAGSVLDIAGKQTGTLTLNGNLVLNGGSLLVSGTTESMDRIAVLGQLRLDGATLLDIDVTLGSGIYTLLTYGSVAGDLGLLSVKDKGVRSSYEVYSSTGNEVLLKVSHKSFDIVWDGASPWETGAEADEFHNGDHMIFNKGGVAALAGMVEPEKITVSGGADLTIAGGGEIQGGGLMVKEGAGTLTLDVSNTYTGGTLLREGSIMVKRNNGLGLGNTEITISGAGNRSILFDKTGGGTLVQGGDIINRGSGSSLVSVSGTRTELTGSLVNTGGLSLEGLWTIRGGLFLDGQGTVTLLSGAAVKTEQDSKLTGGATLVLNAGMKSGEGAALLEGNMLISDGEVILNENTAMTGTTMIGKSGVVRILGSTSKGGRMELAEGGSLDITEGSVLYSDVAVLDKALLNLKKGAGVNGCLEVKEDGLVRVEGDTARTGLILLTGKNQLQINKGAVLNSDLYLGAAASHVMDQAQHLGGNLLADSGSTLYINDFVRLDGDYTVTNLRKDFGYHTMYFNMTADMLKAGAGRPVFTLGGVLVSEAALRITIDMRQAVEEADTLYYTLFSSDLDEVSRRTIEGARVEIVDENGWRASITRDIFARLSGGMDKGDLVWTAPRGIGEVSTNSLWSTTRSMEAFAGTVREHTNSALVGQERRQSVWVSSLSNIFNLSNDGVHPGYEYTSNGYALGTDYLVNPCWTMGVAFGQTIGKNKMKDNGGQFDQDFLSAGLYTDINFCHDDGTPGEFALSGWLGYGSSANDGSVISPDLGNESFRGSWDDDSLMFDVRGTWTRRMTERTSVSLFAGLQYVSTEQSDFTLVGGKGQYSYRDGSLSTLRMPVGAGINHAIPLGGVRNVTLYAAASLIPDLMRDDPETKVKAVTRSWTAEGSNPGDISFNVKAGLIYRMNTNWSLSAGYEFEAAAGTNDHSGRISATYAF